MPHAAIPFLVGAVLPYCAVAVFLAGVTYRLVFWKRLPQPGTMTLFPTGGSGIAPLAKEALFFPGLYRGDRFLWTLAWIFHMSLLLAFVGHLRLVTTLIDRTLGRAGVTPTDVAAMSTFLGGLAGAVLLVALAGLFARRVLVPRVREISTAPDFVALLLLAAVVTTGNLMRWTGGADDITHAREWATSILSFAPVAPRSAALLLHALCAELLIVYVAFSKLMHFGGIFLTLSLTKRTAQ